ncbi:MAG: lamin tail domain-containing protein [Saprospiraceae bacterium]|nr:lamin tail domain-containing protein [Saprospiraceae bacterium]
MAAQSNVVINEVMASNVAYITDENGEYEDWIELYNNSGSSVNLGGWFLSDNPDNLDKWEFPTNTIIPAMGYIIIWADEDSSQGPLHANFKLSAMGEELLLINASGSTVQDITFGQQQADKGYARSPNGTGNFTIKNPTFKANNDTGISAVGEEEREDSLTIFPNPASGSEVFLRSNKQGKQFVEVFNQVGQKVYSAIFSKNATMEVGQWPVGLYLVKTEAGRQLLIVQ